MLLEILSEIQCTPCQARVATRPSDGKVSKIDGKGIFINNVFLVGSINNVPTTLKTGVIQKRIIKILASKNKKGGHEKHFDF